MKITLIYLVGEMARIIHIHQKISIFLVITVGIRIRILTDLLITMERPPPQPPNVRRGKVFAGSVEVLDWSETGLVIDMGGSKTDKSKRKDEVVAKEAPPPKDENAGKVAF